MLHSHTFSVHSDARIPGASEDSYFATHGAAFWVLFAVAVVLYLRLKLVETEARHQRALDEDSARARAWRRHLRRTTCTPFETPMCLNKILMELWPTFVEPKMMRKIGSKMARLIAENAPSNMDITVESLTLGSAAPQLSDLQAFSYEEGGLANFDSRVRFVSEELNVSIAALVKTSKMAINCRAAVTGISLKGTLSFFPVPSERLILYGFKAMPDAKLQLRVKPLGGFEAEIGGFSFLERLLKSQIKKRLLLPNLKCIGLEFEEPYPYASGAQLLVVVQRVSGLLPSLREVRLEVKLQRVSRASSAKVDATGAVIFGQRLLLELDGEDGQLVFRLSEQKKAIGSCALQVEHMADGAAAWWGQLADGPRAKRQEPGGAPWEVELPLEGATGITLSAEVSVVQWHHPSPEHPGAGPGSGTAGGRTILLHVVECRSAVAQSGQRTGLMVRAKCAGEERCTAVIKRTLTPFWNDVLAFEQKPHTSKIAMEVVNRSGGSERTLGRASLKLDAIPSDCATNKWLHLEGTAQGELHVRAMAVRGVPGDSAVESVANLMREHYDRLEVTVESGSSLMACDRFGTSDPYVVVSYGSAEHRTKTLRKTLNPVWNHCFHLRLQGAESLILAVYDWDCVGEDDFMGRVEISDREIQLLGQAEESRTHLVLEGVESGMLCVKLRRFVAKGQRAEPLESRRDDREGRHSYEPSLMSTTKCVQTDCSSPFQDEGCSRKSLESLSSSEGSPMSRSRRRFSFSAPLIFSRKGKSFSRFRTKRSDTTGNTAVTNDSSPSHVSSEEQIRCLQQRLDEKEAEMLSMKAEYTAAMQQMKHDQETLLGKLRMFEDELVTLPVSVAE